MTYQILFSGKKSKKTISKCCLLKFLPRELSVKVVKIIGSDGRILWFGSMKKQKK